MSRSTCILALVAVTAAGGGCAQRAAGGAAHVVQAELSGAGSAPPAKPSSPAMPIATFHAPEAWQPSFGDGTPVEPPDPTQEVWRAFVTQAEPMQKETPVWQPVAAKEVVALQMPAESRFRCFVNPLEVAPIPDDYNTKLQAWLLKREVVCSSDDFATWTSYPHRVHVTPDGKREVMLESEALLRERGPDGTRALYVLFRSDREIRQASTGGPRVLPGVEVHD